jgi:Type I phosphodiesterase / nucleotide pyrophosphatase
MSEPRPPDASGGGLVNLSAEVERRLSGSAPYPGLEGFSRGHDADRTQVVVLFDGLGEGQVDHPRSAALSSSLVAGLDAPFPTTTTVSLATFVTGTMPSDHGLIAYLLWDPEVRTIVNTIHMTSAWGDELDLDLAGFLPRPNMFERLASKGIESVVVQPRNFSGSSLTRVLYRGARFEGYATVDEAVEVTADVAAHPGRLVIVYVPHVDVAAHVAGTKSREYEDALSTVDTLWSRLLHGLADEVDLLASADHGHVDIEESAKTMLSPSAQKQARIWGDPRVLFIEGDPSGILDETGGRWVDGQAVGHLLGPSPMSDAALRRIPDGAIMMPDRTAAYTNFMNERLIGHHGGLSDDERRVPLLMRR